VPWNILLLPLIGGYFALHLFYYSRSRARRQEGYRLLLDSALAGLSLIPPARGIVLLIKSTGPGQALGDLWTAAVGSVPYAGTGAAALLLGVTLPLVLNVVAASLLHGLGSGPRASPPDRSSFRPAAQPRSRWLELLGIAIAHVRWSVACIGRWLQPARDHAEDWAMQFSEDPMHRVFRRAIQAERPVMVTLKDRKVYIGLVWELPKSEVDDERKSISMLPVLSGHRDSDQLRLEVDTVYPDYDDLDPALGVAPEDFLIAFPWQQIQNAHLFIQEVYERYFNQQQPN
jgi:hypothetical protein